MIHKQIKNKPHRSPYEVL